MKRKPLTQGKYATVDDADYEALSRFKWYFNNGYARRNKKPRGVGLLHMHRVIANTPNGMFTDHINGNKLDNRRENLRVCTHSLNKANRGKPKNNTSGFKGVFYQKDHRRKKPWTAHITVKRKSIALGYFSTKHEAALAYNKAAKELFGEFARPNVL